MTTVKAVNLRVPCLSGGGGELSRLQVQGTPVRGTDVISALLPLHSIYA